MVEGIEGFLKKEYSDNAFFSTPRKEFGLFLKFRNDANKPIKFIREITFYRLTFMSTDDAAAVGISLPSGAIGQFQLTKLPKLNAVPYLATHKNDAGNVASWSEISTDVPKLHLEDIGKGEDHISLLRGYDEEVEVAFLDGLSLWQMQKAHSVLSPPASSAVPDFTFFYSGARANYGEMTGPLNQHDRIKNWTSGRMDPSLAFTLKTEPIGKISATGEYYKSIDIINPKYVALTQVALPGFFLLDPCKTYWKSVQVVQSTYEEESDNNDLIVAMEDMVDFLENLGGSFFSVFRRRRLRRKINELKTLTTSLSHQESKEKNNRLKVIRSVSDASFQEMVRSGQSVIVK